MNQNEALMIVLAAILIAAAIVIAFAVIDTATAPEIIPPAGPMTGEQIHPVGYEINMSEMIYVPAYPDEPCTLADRILLDDPIRIEDETGTVRMHWLYDNRTIARNRT